MNRALLSALLAVLAAAPASAAAAKGPRRPGLSLPPSTLQAGAQGLGRAPLALATDAEIEDLYRAAAPRGLAFDLARREGLSFASLSEKVGLKLVVQNGFDGDFLRRVRAHGSPDVIELVDVLDASTDEASRRFAGAVGRRVGHREAEEIAADGDDYAAPPNPLGSGPYWDLATGPNGVRLMRTMDQSSDYTLIDNSAFSLGMLEGGRDAWSRRGRDLSRVSILDADVRTLSPPDAPLSVLRAKNVNSYVPGAAEAVARLTAAIAAGGRLILQTDHNPAQHGLLLADYAALAARLLAEGWTLDVSFNDPSTPLDTVSFTRPGGAAPTGPSKTWADVAAAIDAAAPPIGLFFIF